MRRCSVVLLGILAACETTQTDPPKGETREPEVREQGGEAKPQGGEAKPPADPNSCMPAGLEAASKVETVVLPRGCQVTTGSLSAPTIVRSEAELAGVITCEPGSQLPAIDFTKHQLHVAEFSLSPAYGGSELFDDGKTVTFVQRDRSPCPDDPLPMPIGSSIAYLLPQGAERSHAQLSCTLPPKCD
jgi:hypothetical protein